MFRSLCIYWSALIYFLNTLFWFLLYRICKTERNFNIDTYQLNKTSSCDSNDFTFISFRFRCESSLCYGIHGGFKPKLPRAEVKFI